MNYEPYIIPKTLADRIHMLQAIAFKQTIFVPIDNGVQIYYPCGTKRFISNAWYNDINTDEL